MEDAVTEQSGRKVVKEIFKMILFDWCHLCSVVLQLMAEDGYERTERSLHLIRIIHMNG